MGSFERGVSRLRKETARVALEASGVAYRALHRAEALLALAAGVVRPRSVESGRKRRRKARPVADQTHQREMKGRGGADGSNH
jgi:hypothetical protein